MIKLKNLNSLNGLKNKISKPLSKLRDNVRQGINLKILTPLMV